MRRREILAGSGIVLTTLAAGCTGGDDDPDSGNGDGEYQDGGNGGNGDGGNGDGEQPDPDDVQQRDRGEDVLEFGDLQVTDHELIVEEGEFSDEIAVEGIVENTSSEMYDYVEVGVRVYDPDGNQLDRYLDNTNDLGGEQTWAFEVPILEDAADVDDFDIGVSGEQYDF